MAGPQRHHHRDHHRHQGPLDCKQGARAEDCDQEPGQGGADGTCQVDGHPVEGHGGRQLGAGHEVRGKRLVDDERGGHARPEREGEAEHGDCRHRVRQGQHRQSRNRGEHQELRAEGESPPVDDVGHRAREQGQ
jgi:hypothetical protein